MGMRSSPSIDLLSRISFDKFNSLPKKGKPSQNEWTVLSTIVQYDEKTNVAKVIAIGTGTKCIGGSQLCPDGLILNDCHAEVIARRSVLRYIYENIQNAGNSDNIFVYNTLKNRFKLKDSISFHFFSTHAPCGDATILTESTDYDQLIECAPPCKKLKFNENTVFTGAKLIGSLISDSMDQKEGALRTKPGRGERTLSMSCSDKLSRWNIMGIQGALLDTLLENPIYIKSFNFCGDVNEFAIHRAIVKRWNDNDNNFKDSRFHAYAPDIRINNCIHFEFNKSDEKVPSPSCISWCDISEENRPLEVAVSGKKQGVVKKDLKSKLGSLEISKVKLFEKYINLLLMNPEVRNTIFSDNSISKLTYYACKENSLDYQRAWKLAKKEYFQNWTEKPQNLLYFHTLRCNLKKTMISDNSNFSVNKIDKFN